MMMLFELNIYVLCNNNTKYLTIQIILRSVAGLKFCCRVLILRITVVKRKYIVKYKNIQVIMQRFLLKRQLIIKNFFIVQFILRIMFSSILIISKLHQSPRYLRWSQRLTKTSVETLT